jgi:hypothetical protein
MKVGASNPVAIDRKQTRSEEMKKEISLVCFLIQMLLTGHLWALNQEDKKFSYTEIKLPPFYQETLKAQSPFEDILVLNDTLDIWVLGKNSLFKWSMAEQKLEKVKFDIHHPGHEDSSGSLFGINQNRLVYLSSRRLVDLKIFPTPTLKQYKIHNLSNGLSRFAAGDDKALYWVHSKSVFEIKHDSATKKATLALIKKLPKPLKNHFWIDIKAKKFWYAEENFVVKSELFSSSQDADQAYDLSGSILGIQFETPYLYAYSKRKIIRIDPLQGTVADEIPVKGKSGLKKMSLSGTHHLYLFDDSHFELFNLTKEQRHSFTIEGISVGTIQKMILQGNLLILLNSGDLRIFILEEE